MRMEERSDDVRIRGPSDAGLRSRREAKGPGRSADVDLLKTAGHNRPLLGTNFLESDSKASTSAIYNSVLKDLSGFTYGANQTDDITMMVIKRN